MTRDAKKTTAGRAAAASDRCQPEAGSYRPVVDRSRCEAKSECVAVCPYNVFDVTRIADADYAALSILGRLRSLAHGRMSAYAVRAELCQACGLCVTGCPERAIKLERVPAFLL